MCPIIIQWPTPENMNSQLNIFSSTPLIDATTSPAVSQSNLHQGDSTSTRDCDPQKYFFFVTFFTHPQTLYQYIENAWNLKKLWGKQAPGIMLIFLFGMGWGWRFAHQVIAAMLVVINKRFLICTFSTTNMAATPLPFGSLGIGCRRTRHAIYFLLITTWGACLHHS